MKIGNKLLLTFVVVIALVGIAGFLFFHQTEKLLVTVRVEQAQREAGITLELLGLQMGHLVTKMQGLGSGGWVFGEIVKSNKKFTELFSGMTETEKTAYIDKQDELWKTATFSGIATPFMDQLLTHKLSTVVRKKNSLWQGDADTPPFREIFLTNKYGLITVLSSPTSDYFQADEYWWKKAVETGVYVSDLEYDESTGEYSFSICIRRDDENGNLAGVVKGVVNVQKFFSLLDKMGTKLKKHTGDPTSRDSTVDVKLLTHDGRLIYASEKEFSIGDDMGSTLNIPWQEDHFAHWYIGKGDTAGEGEELFVYQCSEYADFEGMDWILVLKYETEEIFAYVKKQKKIAIFIVVFLLVVVFLGRWFVTHYWITRHLNRMIRAVKKVGAGEFDARIEIRSNDEFGVLARAFNTMASKLNSFSSELVKARDYTNNIISSMDEILIVTSQDGVIEKVNDAACKLLDHTEKELSGRQVRELFVEDDDGILNEKLINLAKGKSFTELDVDCRSGNNRKIPIFLSGSIMWSEDGAVQALLFIASDMQDSKLMRELQEITEQLGQKIIEQEKTEKELIIAKEFAENANRVKSEFLANMSHEVRTPMNAIIGLSELALDSKLSRKHRDYLEKIHRSSRSLLGIINDILDLSRIEAGKLTMEKKGFCLQEVLEGIATLFSPRIQKKDIEFLIHHHSDVPVFLVGDALRLHQILVNLVGNSLKFTEKGEISVMVTLEAREQDEVILKFTVRDSGIGINLENPDTLFEHFTQADSSTTRKYGGTGLGLSICKQLVEMMDGHIDVSSPKGMGTVFSFTARFGLSADKPANVLKAAGNIPKLRILVVDDNEANGQLVSAILSSFSFIPTVASSGEDALALLNEPESTFDLAIIDWKMPGMDGVATCEAIRRNKTISSLPVLMISGYDPEELKGVVGSLAQGFLAKPITVSPLFDAITTILGYETIREYDQPDEWTHHKSSSMTRIKGARVLLVEDNSINRQVIEEMLAKAELYVEAAENGQVALEKINGTGEGYDIVLMDIQMPVMDGFQTTEEIRKKEKTLPVIAMTANAMDGDRDKCLAVGMDDYMAKPISRKELFEVLSRWIPENMNERKMQNKQPATHLNVDARELQNSSSENRNPTLPESIAGINIKQGLGRVDGDLALYLRLVKEFVDNYRTVDQEILAALESGDQEGGDRLVHTIKGVAGTLGAADLAAASLALEQAAKTKTGRAAPFSHFQSALQVAVTSFSTLLAAGEEEQSAVQQNIPYDRDRVAKELAQLSVMLKNNDFEAVNKWQDLKMQLQEQPSATLDTIENCLNTFDFEGALKILPEIHC